MIEEFGEWIGEGVDSGLMLCRQRDWRGNGAILTFGGLGRL